jgi:hypothetical protein
VNPLNSPETVLRGSATSPKPPDRSVFTLKIKNNMSAYWDYIPKRDSELVAWSANFTAQVAANAQEWEIPPLEVVALQAADVAFATLHTQADSPSRNSVIVAEKNAARKTLEAKIRELNGFRLKNPVITDEQRSALGLHVRDTTPTIIPPPQTSPVLDLEPAGVRRLNVVFHDNDSANKAKPYGVSSALIVYAVLDAPPDSPDDLVKSALAARAPHLLEFTERERGKRAYAAVCWQNEKGERGPWSEIENAIVP